MTVKTLGPRDAAYLVREVGPISREAATVASGETLVAGTVVALDGEGKIVAHPGTLDTAGEADPAVAGIVLESIDASATGVNDDVPGVPYTARLAEVAEAELIFPAESTAGGEKAALVAGLASLFIILR